MNIGAKVRYIDTYEREYGYYRTGTVDAIADDICTIRWPAEFLCSCGCGEMLARDVVTKTPAHMLRTA